MTITPVPKPQPRTALEKRASRIATQRELESRTRLARIEKQKRGRPLQGKAIKPRSKKRASKAEDERIYGPELFRIFLHNHRCLGCGEAFPRWQIQQAHVKSGGMGRKDDWQRTGPLCGSRSRFEGGRWIITIGCHRSYDSAKKSFRTHDGLTYTAAQQRFFQEYERHAVLCRKLKGCDE